MKSIGFDRFDKSMQEMKIEISAIATYRCSRQLAFFYDASSCNLLIALNFS